jgi:hypothetical protein
MFWNVVAYASVFVPVTVKTRFVPILLLIET